MADGIPQPPDGVPVWTLHWLYHPGAGGIWTVADWDGAMWCVAGSRDRLDGWNYICPAVPPATPTASQADDGAPE